MRPAGLHVFLQKFQSRSGQKTTGIMTLYWLAVIVYLELLLHGAAFGMPGKGFFLVVLFHIPFAGVLALATLMLPKKARVVVTAILTLILTLLYGSQMVYYFIFGSLYTVSQIQQGGAAITSFWREMFLVMGKNLQWLLPLLLPELLLILLHKRLTVMWGRSSLVWGTVLLALVLVFQCTAIACVQIGGTGYFSNYHFYHSASTTTAQSTQRFGLLTAFRLDIQGQKETSQPGNEVSYHVPEQTTPETQPLGTSTEPTQAEEQDRETAPTEPQNPYNTLDIDFDLLSSLTDDKTIQGINQYCASVAGTKKNEYTGMFQDYNLIVLCAESFSPGVIDKELTPTLYKLANEGILFQNYYTTFPNNTTDGEYTFCMGLYPDMTRGKTIASFYASRNSYLPYCLGNIFRQQRGVESYGYHNYFGNYYGRNESHPNMGYTMKFAGDGMEFSTEWPSSDLEMMMQSVDDYLRADEQFHAYYMTFSGHLAYDTRANPMAVRNWDLVKDLPYCYEAKCYLSCNIELDRALAYLLQRLEEAGVADRTAIVLAPDHHPYGLTDDQYSNLMGETIVKFTKYKSNLIFWAGGLEEPIVVDEYCCTVDILPTILNLWGFEFDSRMLTGTDVFSDGMHVAVLSDKSFFTDKVWVNAEHGIIQYLVDPKELPAGYMEDMIRTVESKYALSADILNSAYYNFVFEKGEVAVNRHSWE